MMVLLLEFGKFRLTFSLLQRPNRCNAERYLVLSMIRTESAYHSEALDVCTGGIINDGFVFKGDEEED